MAQAICSRAGEPGKVVVRIGPWIGRAVLVIVVAPSWGCAHGPRNFRKVQSPAPLVRARAVGLGRRQADSQVMPALVDRLSDSDPVVRLAAHEELRKRTGRDFGYVPWASPEERAGAIEQWRAFVGQGRGSPDRTARPLASPSPQSKTLPGGTSQAPVS
jgi:hypothetical protein